MFLAAAIAGGIALGNCGSDTPTQVPVPTTTVAPQPTPTPTPAPTPTPTPTPAASACGNLPPGPVVRYAISPRELIVGDARQQRILVRARPGFDEVWCVDKDAGDMRLDFNSSQRNDAGRECCWKDEPSWDVVEDREGIVTSHNSLGGSNGFNHRYRIDPRGRRGTVLVQAQVDGIKSHPWQSQSGYTEGPLAIVSMSKDEIARDCRCIYKGNGQYEGDNCSKLR